MSDFSAITSHTGLIQYFSEKDMDRDGLLDETEIDKEAIGPHDRNGDLALSPAEVMEAINAAREKFVFTRKEIEWHEKGLVYFKSWNPRNPSGRIDEVDRGRGIPRGTEIHFDPSGYVAEIILGGAAIIDGRFFTKGSKIKFHERLMSMAEVVLGMDQEVQNIRFHKGTKIYFRLVNEQDMMAAELAADQPLPVSLGSPPQMQQVYFAKYDSTLGNSVKFFDDGTVQAGTLVKDQEVLLEAGDVQHRYSIRAAGGSYIEFDFDFDNKEFPIRPTEFTLAADQAILGYFFPAGTTFRFRKSWEGNPTFAILPRDWTIEGFRIRKGNKILFDHDGKIVRESYFPMFELEGGILLGGGYYSLSGATEDAGWNRAIGFSAGPSYYLPTPSKRWSLTYQFHYQELPLTFEDLTFKKYRATGHRLLAGYVVKRDDGRGLPRSSLGIRVGPTLDETSLDFTPGRGHAFGAVGRFDFSLGGPPHFNFKMPLEISISKGDRSFTFLMSAGIAIGAIPIYYPYRGEPATRERREGSFLF